VNVLLFLPFHSFFVLLSCDVWIHFPLFSSSTNLFLLFLFLLLQYTWFKQECLKEI
jgi:hypothetical protein